MINRFLLFILLFAPAVGFGQAAPPKHKSSTQPFVLGVVDALQSTELNEKRILNIYLPEGYNPKDTTTYPVIYLLDGSADEDFIHIVGLVQFNSFEWIKLVPKSIVVGIATVDRRRDFTFPTTIASDKKAYPTTGHSNKFIRFMENELQPFIKTNYKANNAKTLIGQSFGGLVATEILLTKPSLFNTYIIVSPSLWWNNGSLLNKDVPFLANTAVYIGVGKEGVTPTAVPRVMEVDANLLAEKLKRAKKNEGTVYFDYLPQENHATILHQAVANAFRLLYAPALKKE